MVAELLAAEVPDLPRAQQIADLPDAVVEGLCAGKSEESMDLAERDAVIATVLVFHMLHLCARNQHANFLAMRSDLKRARALAEKALLLSPDQPDAITLLGKIYASQGYTLKAIELYEKAVAAAKAKGEPVSDIYPLLIQDYLSQGDIQKAFKATQALLHYSNQSPDGYFFLGLIYDEYFNNPEKALQAYNQVLLYNPRDTLVLGRMAQIYIAQRQYDAALSVLKRIEDIDPHNAGTLLKIALIDYEQGKKAEAKALFEQIARENPDSDRIHYYLGILHFEDNHYALARDELKRVPKTSDYYVLLPAR